MEVGLLEGLWAGAFRFLALLCLLMCPPSVYAEEAGYAAFLKRWKDRPVKELAGKGYAEQQDRELSMAWYSVAVSKYSESMPEEDKYYCAISMNNIAYIYLFVYHNPEQAYPWLAKALDLSEKNGFTDIVPGICGNIAKIHDDYGDAAAAIDIYRKAFGMTLKPDGKSGGMRYTMMLMAFNDMVATAFHRGMLDSIADEMDAFRRQELPSMPLSGYSVRLCEGMELMRRRDFARAAAVLEKSSGLIDSNVDRERYMTLHYVYLAEAYKCAGHPDASMDCLKKAERTAQEAVLSDLLPRIYRNMAAIHLLAGRTDSANAQLFKAMSVRDSLFDVRGFCRIKNMENAATVDALNRDIREADDRQRQSQKTIRILAGCFAVIIFLLLFIVKRNRQLTAGNRALVRKSREAIANQEMERRLRRDYEEKLVRYAEKPDEAMPAGNAAGRSVPIPLCEHEVLRVVASVKDIMEGSHDIFSPDFSLEQLAEMTGVKPKYLSGIINDSFHKNLNQLLAEARIREACKRLSDKDAFGTWTIDAIAESVGYKSRTHFSSVFKKITGLSPSKYAAIARCENRQMGS